MVWYPIDWCHRTGITDITLITPPECKEAIQDALSKDPSLTSLPSPKVKILAPPDLTQTTGTGQLLRLPEVQTCITRDFMILPCDLISELDGGKILQQWMTLNPLSSSIACGKHKGGMAVIYPTQGKKDETDFFATVPIPPSKAPPPNSSLRPNVQQVVLNMPTDTLNDKIEDGKGFYRLRQSLLQKHPRVNMKTKYRDAHVYIFPKWVKDFVARNEKFDSVSEDVLGWWAKAGWQEGLADKLGMSEILSKGGNGVSGGTDSPKDPSINADLLDPATLSTTQASQAVQAPVSHAFASRVGATAPTSSMPAAAVPPVLTYIQPKTTPDAPQPLIRRVDTSAELLSMSLYLAKQPTTLILSHENKVHSSATLEQQARVSQEDSLVGENVKLGFRSNIKECVIAANCEIGKNVRLTRCLLMEGVVVGDGAQMSGCIIGRRAKIEGISPAPTAAEADGAAGKGKKKAVDNEEERTKLTDCEVAPNFVVEAGTEAKGEKLMVFETDDLDGIDDGDGLEEDQPA